MDFRNGNWAKRVPCDEILVTLREGPPEISSQNRKFLFFTIVEIKDKRASVTQMQNTDLSKR